MILAIEVIIKIIATIIITMIIKCRGRYKTPTTTNAGLLVTLYNCRKPLTNIKKSSISDIRCVEGPICTTDTAYSLLDLMNRGRLCGLNSLLRTLPILISQEYL